MGSEERLGLAMDSAAVGMWDVDLKSGIAYASDIQFKLLGLRPRPDHTMTQAMWEERVHPEDLPVVLSTLNKAMATQGIYSAEYRVIRADDSKIRWVQAVGRYTYNDVGQAERLTGVFFDVTQRKQAEIKVRQAEEDLNRAQAIAEIGSWRYDAQNNRSELSDELRRILGRKDQSSIEFEEYMQLVHPDDRGYVRQSWENALKGSPFDIEYQIIINGETKWVRARAELKFFEDGSLLSGLGTVQDITVRKRYEQELHEYRTALEIKVKERTLQLEELSFKTVQALEADRRMISRYLHDTIGADLAALKFRIEEAQPNAGPLKDIVFSLHQIIRDLKNISVSMRPMTIDDLGLLSTIENQLKGFNREYGIKAESQLDIQEDEIPDTVKISIYRILQEALSNAGKYSRAKQVIITLRRESDNIQLFVQDDGVGFDISKLTKPPYGINGMRERVQVCRGNFGIASLPGHGTTLQATFPI